MGQYFMPMVIDEVGNITTLYSHDFENGLKLMEHSWIGNSFVNAVASLIVKKPCRVAWIGDYSDDFFGKDAYEKAMPQEDFMKYYEAAWGEERSHQLVPSKLPEGWERVITKNSEGYLVNHTKKIVLDIKKYIGRNECAFGDWMGWCVNPLPLLTACGNGRGGGDYNYRAKVGLEHVGTWAFDVIELTDTKPDGYEEVMYEFREWD